MKPKMIKNSPFDPKEFILPPKETEETKEMTVSMCKPTILSTLLSDVEEDASPKSDKSESISDGSESPYSKSMVIKVSKTTPHSPMKAFQNLINKKTVRFE